MNSSKFTVSQPDVSIIIRLRGMDYTQAHDKNRSKVQKQRPLIAAQANHLREVGLINGRKPKHFISANFAKTSDDKVQYIHNIGLSNQHFKQLICKYLESLESARRTDIYSLHLDNLPEILDKKQKRTR